MIRYRLLIVSLLLLANSAWGGAASPTVQDGDVIFHSSRSAQSEAIQRATASPYSHCGIIFFHKGKPYVFEAVTTVRFTPLQKWIARGTGGKFVIKRLKDGKTLLPKEAIAKLRMEALRFKGKKYDMTFEWSDDRIYCSELVWKAYNRALGIKLGTLQRLREFNLSEPIVASKLNERYGSKIPMDEPVISPASIFNSRELITAAKN